MDIKKAIDILKENAKESETSEAMLKAVEIMESVQGAKTSWFKLNGNGEISYQTTPKGYGSKVLCKVVPLDELPKTCPCCGALIAIKE